MKDAAIIVGYAVAALAMGRYVARAMLHSDFVDHPCAPADYAMTAMLAIIAAVLWPPVVAALLVYPVLVRVGKWAERL